MPYLIKNLFFFFLIFAFPFLFQEVRAVPMIELSDKIAASVSKIKNEKYKTIAFSRIKGKDPREIDRLIDYSNVNLVKRRRFSVTDRSRLEQILKEQRYNLSELISPDSYKKIGNLLGVDLFLYGAFYNEELIIKAIDVETSELVWADIFYSETPDEEREIYLNITEAFINSLRKDLGNMSSVGDQVSFWGIETSLDQSRLIDYLSYAMARDGNFKIVDRENLSDIINEQKLNLESYIDPAKAKNMGELYGVDSFIYGSVKKEGGSWISSLKMMNINTGVIVWADLLQTNSEPVKVSANENQSKYAVSNTMVEIPGGSYVIGSNDDLLASPRHRVVVKGFAIDKYEVSNEDYYIFVSKYKHRPPQNWRGGKPYPGTEKHPVTLVSWTDAEKYCRTFNKRLPLESEWEVAFRGSAESRYPWQGNRFWANNTNTAETKNKSSLPVNAATKDVSVYGVYFMAGNVREWIGSRLRQYPSNNYQTAEYNSNRVIRGSSWAQPAAKAVGWFRDSSRPDYGYKDVGFRCATYTE